MTATMERKDTVVEGIERILEKYRADHPTAVADYYRYNSVAVRLRIVDPAFRGVKKGERQDRFEEHYLAVLPEEIQEQISLILLLTPEEKVESLGSFDFDHPIPSRL